MKRVLLIFAVLLIAVGVYWFFIKEKPKAHAEEAKAAPLVARKHSAGFNNSMDSLLSAYFSMKDAFVNADSTSAKAASSKLAILADSGSLSELKTDAPGIYESALMQLNDVKASAESLVKQTNLTEMRQDFNMIGENIYPLLKTIHYDGKILYWQNCPMAFGEDKGANWISNTAEIINPYLGKNHPEFKSTMLHCGEVKDSIKAK
ncbi:MAG: DUF3347 domain-containing protein [Ferruginibacter sp.]